MIDKLIENLETDEKRQEAFKMRTEDDDTIYHTFAYDCTTHFDSDDERDAVLGVLKKYFPNTESCFFNGIESGQNYKVECWINEMTKVRTRD